MLNNTILS